MIKNELRGRSDLILSMISAKLILKIGLVSLFMAVFCFLLILLNVTAGKYLVYIFVAVGAITAILGAIASLTGNIKDDLRK